MSSVPISIAIQITTKCDLKCGHCVLSCSSEKSRCIELDQARDCIDAAKTLNIKNLSITGGEPLQNPELLFAILRMAQDALLKVSLITNGSWATNAQDRKQILELLTLSGLNRLEVSWDIFHQKFINEDMLGQIIESAKQLKCGLTVLCGLSRHPENLDVVRTLSTLPVDIVFFPITRQGRATNLQRKYFTPIPGYSPRCLQAEQPFVLADGRVLLCCGLAGFSSNSSFSSSAGILGDLNEEKMKEILTYSMVDLRRAFASFSITEIFQASGLRVDEIIKSKYSSMCEICKDILENSGAVSKIEALSIREDTPKDRPSSDWPEEVDFMSCSIPYGTTVKLKHPSFLCQNVADFFGRASGSGDFDLGGVLGYLDDDSLCSFKILSKNLVEEIKPMLDGSARVLEDPNNMESLETPSDIKEYFRRLMMVSAYTNGILSTVRANSPQQSRIE